MLAAVIVTSALPGFKRPRVGQHEVRPGHRNELPRLVRHRPAVRIGPAIRHSFVPQLAEFVDALLFVPRQRFEDRLERPVATLQPAEERCPDSIAKVVPDGLALAVTLFAIQAELQRSVAGTGGHASFLGVCLTRVTREWTRSRHWLQLLRPWKQRGYDISALTSLIWSAHSLMPMATAKQKAAGICEEESALLSHFNYSLIIVIRIEK